MGKELREIGVWSCWGLAGVSCGEKTLPIPGFGGKRGAEALAPPQGQAAEQLSGRWPKGHAKEAVRRGAYVWRLGGGPPGCLPGMRQPPPWRPSRKWRVRTATVAAPERAWRPTGYCARGASSAASLALVFSEAALSARTVQLTCAAQAEEQVPRTPLPGRARQGLSPARRLLLHCGQIPRREWTGRSDARCQSPDASVHFGVRPRSRFFPSLRRRCPVDILRGRIAWEKGRSRSCS